VSAEWVNIGPEEIHIWIAKFQPEDNVSGRTVSILSPAELKRAEAFRFSEDRMRYIQAHSVLRRILSSYSGSDPESLEYETNAHGKPYLKGSHRIFFNLSHTRDMMAVAVSAEKEIGVDIEKQDDMDDMDGVARQFMSNEELQWMEKLRHDFRKRFFYLCWVRKEALLKAVGIGLGDHLRRITATKAPDEENIAVLLDDRFGRWRMETFDPSYGHIGAVCIESAADIKEMFLVFKTINGLNQDE